MSVWLLRPQICILNVPIFIKLSANKPESIKCYGQGNKNGGAGEALALECYSSPQFCHFPVKQKGKGTA